MNLLVDIGNSRIKMCILTGRELLGRVLYDYSNVEFHAKWLDSVVDKPEDIYLISVGSTEIERALSDACYQRWSLRPKSLSSEQSCCGVRNGYSAPSELGIDRWAAIVGAYTFIGNSVLVIDCGTACTADVIDKNGNHLGGAIMPGQQMMQQSLLAGTERIAVIDTIRTGDPLGRTTSECVALGISDALVGFIERIERDAVNLLGTDLCVVITGGGAQALLPLLGGHVRHVEELLFMGMSEIIKERKGSAGGI